MLLFHCHIGRRTLTCLALLAVIGMLLPTHCKAEDNITGAKDRDRLGKNKRRRRGILKIDFDEFSGQHGYYYNHFIQMENFSWLNSTQYNHVGYGGYSQDMTISCPGGSFDILSMCLTSPHHDNLHILFNGTLIQNDRRGIAVDHNQGTIVVPNHREMNCHKFQGGFRDLSSIIMSPHNESGVRSRLFVDNIKIKINRPCDVDNRDVIPPTSSETEKRCKFLVKMSMDEINGSQKEEAICELNNGSIVAFTGENEKRVQSFFLEKFKNGEMKSGVTYFSTEKCNVIDNESKLELLLDNESDWQKGIISPVWTEEPFNTVPFEDNNTNSEALIVTTKTMLVLRVITGGGSQVPPSNERRLSDKWFGTSTDEVNNKSQFRACSFGKLLIEPFTGNTSKGVNISNGVYTITVDADRMNPRLVERQARAKGSSILGDLQSQFDFVALSVPDNEERYAAYAYVNSWLSLYKDRYVDYVTVQMHEIGHNIGLAHSGEGASTYGDTSGLMGALWDDDRNICFNGPKNAQLGWYSDREVHVSIDGYNGDLYGIADYGKTDSSAKMILKLYNSGSDTDYYVTFNKAVGVNSNPGEGKNQVLLHSRPAGLGYGESRLIAKLSAGVSYSGGPMDITVVSIGATAQVVIGGGLCIDTPNWVDSYGDGCEWYERYESQGCPRYGNYFNAGYGTPNEGCCWCGGGSSRVSTITYEA